MSVDNEIKELKQLAKATAAIGFMLWSALPIFVLGWLASAVGRHPIAEEQITSEPVYKFLLWWQGGLNSFPPILLLILFISFLIALSYVLRKYGYSHPVDGMGKGRIFIRKFLLPAFLSFSAFAAGVVSGGSLSEMKPGVFFLLVFSVFAALIHYFVDSTEGD